MSEERAPNVGSAVRLTVVSTIASGAIQAAVVFVLARLIGPVEYGSYVLCIAVLSVSSNFIANAVERSLVVAETIDYRGLMSSTGAIALMTALATLAATYCLVRAGLLSVRLDLLAVLLAGALFSALAIPPRVYLRRKLDYRWIVSSELAGIVLGVGGTAIALASLGYGAYALVFGAAVQNLVTLVIVTVGGLAGASIVVSGGVLMKTLRGMLNVSRLTVLEVVHGQIPNFFISTLGPAALGLYNRSQTIVQLPVQLVTASMSRVMISGIARVANDQARLLRASRLTVMTTGAIIAPVNFGIAGSYVQFTDVILGQKWLAAAPLVPALAITSWALMTAVILGVISEAARRFGGKATVQGLTSAMLVGLLAVGVKFGLLPATLAIAGAGVFLMTANIYLTAKVLEIEMLKVAAWLGPSVLAGLACAGYSWAASAVLTRLPSVATLAVQIAGCGLITAAYYALFQREILISVGHATLPPKWIAKLEQMLPIRLVRAD